MLRTEARPHPISAHILAAAALVAPPLAVFAPLGMAPLLALAALALLAFAARGAVAAARRFAALAGLLLLLSLWAMASALWSVIPGHSLAEGARLLLISLGGLILLGAGSAAGSDSARRLAAASLIGLALAVLLLQIELRAGAPLLHLMRGLSADRRISTAFYDRGTTVLLLAAWPALAFLAGERRFAAIAVLVIAVCATIFIASSHAAMLGLLVGATILPLAWWRPRLAAGALVAGVAAVALIYPVAAPDGPAIARLQRAAPALNGSAIHRLAIWRFASERIAERPLLGWGMDSSRALPGGNERVIDRMPQLRLSPSAKALPLHPHNAALQWRLELGLPGTLLALAALAWSLFAAAGDRSAPRWYCALALGYAASASTIALLSFGIWQSWWLSTLWLTAAVFIALHPCPHPALRATLSRRRERG